MVKEIKRLNEAEIGSVLKRLRTEKGLTLKQLADMSGVTQSAISRYENNKRMPTMIVLYALMDALEVDLFISKR